MAKQVTDTRTVDLLPLELAPIPKKRGRHPKGEKAMTPAERMASMRQRKAEAGVKPVYLNNDELQVLRGLLQGEINKTKCDIEKWPNSSHVFIRRLDICQVLYKKLY